MAEEYKSWPKFATAGLHYKEVCLALSGECSLVVSLTDQKGGGKCMLTPFFFFPPNDGVVIP